MSLENYLQKAAGLDAAHRDHGCEQGECEKQGQGGSDQENSSTLTLTRLAHPHTTPSTHQAPTPPSEGPIQKQRSLPTQCERRSQAPADTTMRSSGPGHLLSHLGEFARCTFLVMGSSLRGSQAVAVGPRAPRRPPRAPPAPLFMIIVTIFAAGLLAGAGAWGCACRVLRNPLGPLFFSGGAVFGRAGRGGLLPPPARLTT